MNEENLKIIVSQKRDIENLRDYVDAGFKVICDWGKRDHEKIKLLRICVGILFVAVYRQSVKIKKLESKINENVNEETVDNDASSDKLEEVTVE